MRHITARRIDEVVSSLPQPERANDKWASTFVADIVVGAAGFEERCLALPQMARGMPGRPADALFYSYPMNEPENKLRLAELQAIAQVSFGSFRIVGPNERDLASELRSLVQSRTRERRPRVLVDISGMSGRLLLFVCRQALLLDCDLTVFYAEAAEYRPTQAEFSLQRPHYVENGGLGLEDGIGEVVPSDSAPGENDPSLPNRVLVLAGFSHTRARAGISYVDPALVQSAHQVDWILGKPRLARDYWRLEAARVVHSLEEGQFVELSTSDYRDSVSLFLSEFRKWYSTANLTVVPLGSKSQIFGLALSLWSHPEVRAVVASPSRYSASDYSKGWGTCWASDLGPTKGLGALMRSVGELTLQRGRL